MVQSLPRRLIPREPVPELPDAASDGGFLAGAGLGRGDACVEASELLGQASLPALAWPHVRLMPIDEKVLLSLRLGFR